MLAASICLIEKVCNIKRYRGVMIQKRDFLFVQFIFNFKNLHTQLLGCSGYYHPKPKSNKY